MRHPPSLSHIAEAQDAANKISIATAPPTGSREARKRFLFLFILFFFGGGRRRQRGSWRKIPPPHSVQNRGKSLAPLTRSDNSTVNFQWISRIPCSEYNTPLSPVRVFYCLYAPNKNTLNCIFPWCESLVFVCHLFFHSYARFIKFRSNKLIRMLGESFFKDVRVTVTVRTPCPCAL